MHRVFLLLETRNRCRDYQAVELRPATGPHRAKISEFSGAPQRQGLLWFLPCVGRPSTLYLDKIVLASSNYASLMAAQSAAADQLVDDFQVEIYIYICIYIDIYIYIYIYRYTHVCIYI